VQLFFVLSVTFLERALQLLWPNFGVAFRVFFLSVLPAPAELKSERNFVQVNIGILAVNLFLLLPPIHDVNMDRRIILFLHTQMYQCFITKLLRAVGCHKPSRIAKMAMQHLMVECCWLQFSLYRYIQALPADPKRRIFSATTAFIASLADAMT